jgi:hypothetical protein
VNRRPPDRLRRGGCLGGFLSLANAFCEAYKGHDTLAMKQQQYGNVGTRAKQNLEYEARR